MIEGLAEVGCLLVLQWPGEPFQASGSLLLLVGAGLTGRRHSGGCPAVAVGEAPKSAIARQVDA
jgi:hypothetical protein